MFAPGLATLGLVGRLVLWYCGKMEKLLELDERRRTNLGKFGNPAHRRYIVTEEPDGTLILTPAVVLAEHEARLLANPTLLARIADTTAHPEKLVKRGRGKRGG